MLVAPGWGDDIMDCESLDDRTAIADYICDMTAELAVLAAWADHTDLARILEMARLQSEQICGRVENVAEEPAPSDLAGIIAGDMAGNTTVVQDADTGPFESTNVIRLSTLRAAQR
ncbi:MAG TPA: hypothetical protein VK825_01045 [Xanthobacteraceae bacterium]|jgi:hypothetical protein|nr:hypothetical protein [Xanthobacteraceae bacterium]